MNKIEMHQKLLDRLHTLYETKNHDYGDSVHDTYKRYGLTSYLVRIEDKINRVRALDKKESYVYDEKLEDTLLDLANYALLAIIDLQIDESEKVTYTSVSNLGSSITYSLGDNITYTSSEKPLFTGDHYEDN